MKIEELTLFSNNLTKQKIFYSEILEFEEIIPYSDKEISFKVGNSILKFIQNKEATPYHFAINIFSNKEQEALFWLKERVSILTDGKTEIQNFESWNAKAIYFYDEDKNIVEFIARKNQQLNSKNAFSTNSLLEISEIGFPTDNIEKVFNKLNQEISILIYSGDFDEFCAIGDEKGMFICVNQFKKKWFPINDKIFPSGFKAKIQQNTKHFVVEYSKDILSITQQI